ncbi:flavin reductase family protein [Fodinicurvata sp. EGI_FJ10296]|uniref:flavin reductase family protein n=1 Tax=Fodinicurvata sp. EGI_FJ10296 TaxID=3231908 RepID=UPI0034513049
MTDAVQSFALTDYTPRQRYKLLSSLVVPRPIALVGTIGPDGTNNAAPYSFFNVVSEDPPLVVLGLQISPAGQRKDTAVNIARTGEFVINLVDDALAQAMNICAIDMPPDESEIDAAGLTLAQSVSIAPKRIVESPAALECREVKTLKFSERRDIVIGEVSHIHVRDKLIDPETLGLDLDHYDPLGRLFAGFYSRQSDRFEMPRISVEEWKSRT